MSDGVRQDFTLDTANAQREMRLLLNRINELEGALRKATDRASGLERKLEDGPRRASKAHGDLAQNLAAVSGGMLSVGTAAALVNRAIAEQVRLLQEGAAAAQAMRNEQEALARGARTGAEFAARSRQAAEAAERTGVKPERAASLLAAATARGAGDAFDAILSGELAAGGSGEALIDAIARSRAFGAGGSAEGIVGGVFAASERFGASPAELATGAGRLLSTGGGVGVDLAEALGLAALSNRALGTEGLAKVQALLRALDDGAQMKVGRTTREVPIDGAGVFGKLAALDSDPKLAAAFAAKLSPEAAEGERLLRQNLDELRQAVADLAAEIRSPQAVNRTLGVLRSDPAYAAGLERNRSEARLQIAALQESGAAGTTRAALEAELGVLAQRANEWGPNFIARKAGGLMIQGGEYAASFFTDYERATARSFQYEAEALRNPLGALGAFFTNRPLADPSFGAAQNYMRGLDPTLAAAEATARAAEAQARMMKEMAAATRELQRMSLNLPRVPTLATPGGRADQ